MVCKTTPSTQNNTKYTKQHQVHKTTPSTQNDTKYTKQHQVHKATPSTQNNTKYTKQSDKELNILLNNKMFVSPRDFFNVWCRTKMVTLH
jgi:cytoskeletal protein RodZ